MKTLSITFTEFIPEQLEEGILYVSMPYSTIAHLCACGCKNEVITPLSPLDWSMTYNGKEISLHPSIGNWQFPCRSHYWIRGNKVVWAGNMLNDIIENNNPRDTHHTIGEKRNHCLQTPPEWRYLHISLRHIL